MRVKMSDKGGLSLDRMAHTLMEFRPIQNASGVFKRDGYEAFYHEDRLYSVRHIKSDAVILVYANNPYAAIEKCKMLGDIENFHVPFDVDKVIAELENLDVHFDNDYSSENKEPMLLRREVFDVINKYLSDGAEHAKLE